MSAMPTMPIDDPALTHEISAAFAWLTQMYFELFEGHLMTPDPDPMGSLAKVDHLRPRIEAAGIPVPEMVNYQIDPLASIIAWRDFLATIVTVH